MPTLTEATKYGTLEQFREVYEPGMATTWVSRTGETLLVMALANNDPGARVAIAHQLLDDGADATVLAGRERFTTAHVLLGHNTHDYDADAGLLRRLLDAGADINAQAGRKWGTPIDTLSRRFGVPDAALTPFYDVIFARDDLDLVSPGPAGISPLERARRARPIRDGLVDRMEDYLLRHGQEVPTDA